MHEEKQKLLHQTYHNLQWLNSALFKLIENFVKRLQRSKSFSKNNGNLINALTIAMHQPRNLSFLSIRNHPKKLLIRCKIWVSPQSSCFQFLEIERINSRNLWKTWSNKWKDPPISFQDKLAPMFNTFSFTEWSNFPVKYFGL